MATRRQRNVDNEVVVISSSPSPELVPAGSNAPVLLHDDFALPDNFEFAPVPNFNDFDIDMDMADALAPPLLQQPEQEEQPMPEFAMLPLEDCLASLLVLFPDIDPNYVRETYNQNMQNVQIQRLDMVDFLANQILEMGGRYPKINREARASKRKREREIADMTAEELQEKYSNVGRMFPRRSAQNLSKKLLRNSFPYIPATFIDQELARNRFSTYMAFGALALIERDFEAQERKPYKKLTRVRKSVAQDEVAQDEDVLDAEERAELLEEYGAAKRIWEAVTLKGRFVAGAAEAIDLAEGELFECGCCFGEVVFAQLTQCEDGHLFCLECGKQNAKTVIGQQKYKLLCMDGSGCQKEFSTHEVKRFCDAGMLDVLQRLEQRDSIQKAGLEDLAECPFCDFAAIVDPVEVDREFRCHNPDCMKISCRLCSKTTHVPMTCEENAKNESQNLRRNVEEAMTEALLRKCGKCGLPYVKEAGCNKIICSRCNTLNCYLCSKVIKDYHHFDDTSRGGKRGNCALFDNTEERHINEVQAAEQEAIAKIRAENPDITEDEMRIRLSKVVLDEEQRRIVENERRLPVHVREQNNPGAAAQNRQQVPVVPEQRRVRRFRLNPMAAIMQPQDPAQLLHRPQVIYPVVPIPFQQMLQVPAVLPPDPGFPFGLPNFQPQLLRPPPLFQVAPVPFLGNPVPFIGGIQAPNPAAPQNPPMGLLRRLGFPLRAAQPVPVPPPAPIPAVPINPPMMPMLYPPPPPQPFLPGPQPHGLVNPMDALNHDNRNRLVRHRSGLQQVAGPVPALDIAAAAAALHTARRDAYKVVHDAAHAIAQPASPVRLRPAKIAKRR